MESGPGGLGPVASEPGKGSFPLPFLPPGGGTTALTAQTRVGAERRGRRCCLLHRFSGAARNPSTPPRPPAILSKTLSTAPSTPQDGISPPFTAPLRAVPGLTPPRSPHPAPSPSALQSDRFGAAVLGSTRHHPRPPNSVSKPCTQKGCSALLPGLFPGPSPPARPIGSSSHSGP